MSNLVPFNFEDKFEINTIIKNDKPHFLARAVASALGYANASQAYQLHCKSLILFNSLELRESNFQNPHPKGEYFILEPDVYRLITKSTKPEAERFEKWLFEEVLPSIRKTGAYNATPNNSITISDVQNIVVNTIKSEFDFRNKEFENSLITKLKEEFRPRIKFGDYAEKKVSNAYDIDEVVKMLHPELPQFTHYALKEKLYNFLRDYHFIGRNSTFPTTRGVKEKIVGIEVVPICYNKPDEVVGKSIKSVIYEEHLNDLCYTFIQFVNAENESKMNLLNKVAEDHDRDAFTDTIEVPYLVTLN